MEKAEIIPVSNRVRVLFFAGIKEKAKTGELFLEIPDYSSVLDLKRIIADLYPAIKEGLQHSIVAVNLEFASDDTIVTQGAEIAFFPPVSGGADVPEKPTLCIIQEEEIAINEVIQNIVTPTSGAVGIFTGVVRSVTQRVVIPVTDYLIYEAYIPMAQEKMMQIAYEIRGQWPQIEGIAIVQRIGRLDSGAISVLIACAAPHRHSGVFDAASYAINRLKEIVPIWKQETGPDGKIWVEGDYRPRVNE